MTELPDLEDLATEAAGAPIRAEVRRLLAALATFPGAGALLARWKQDLGYPSKLPVGDVTSMVTLALQSGYQAAQDSAGMQGVFVTAAPIVLPLSVRTALDGIRKAVADQLKLGGILFRQVTDKPSMLAAIGSVAQAANRAEQAASWTVVRAHTSGQLAVEQSDDRLTSIWRAERDSCVRCTSYAGMFREADGFPVAPWAPPGKHQLPPVHPHCRCTIVVGTPDGLKGLSNSLEREARRSILRGDALPSESTKARLQAAERLLAKGADLPASVEARSRRAVKAGSFKEARSREK